MLLGVLFYAVSLPSLFQQSIAIVIRPNAVDISRNLQKNFLSSFWITILNSIEEGLSELVSHLSNSPIKAFPDASTCKNFDVKTVNFVMRALSETPWLLREFFGQESCANHIANKFNLENRFLELGFIDVCREKQGLFTNLKPSSWTLSLASSFLRFLPSHPNVARWIKAIPSSISPDNLISQHYDLALTLTSGINLSRSSVLSKAIIGSITNCSISVPGLLRYMSVTSQVKVSNLKEIGKISTKYLANLKALFPAFYLFFEQIFFSKVSCGQSFVDAVRLLPKVAESWHKLATTYVDMIIVWCRVYKENPLKYGPFPNLPILYSEHLDELFKGVGSLQLFQNVASSIFMHDNSALCRALRADVKWIQNFDGNIFDKMRCACTQIMSLDERRLGHNRRTHKNMSNFIANRLTEMHTRNEYRAIYQLRSIFFLDTKSFLQNIVISSGDYIHAGYADSKFGTLPLFNMRSKSENCLIASVINYSLLAYRTPNVLLEQNFCADVASFDTTPTIYRKQHSGSKDQNVSKKVDATVLRFMRAILRQGSLKYVPQELWCSIISAQINSL